MYVSMIHVDVDVSTKQNEEVYDVIYQDCSLGSSNTFYFIDIAKTVNPYVFFSINV